MAKKQKVLFLCTGNSCRSQIAEGFLRDMARDRFDVYSTGLKPSFVNPLAIRVMDEIGLDISGHTSDHLDKFLGEQFDYLITVCDHAQASCPIFPGAGTQLHWGFMDPAEVVGNEIERLVVFRRVRGEIQQQIQKWLETLDSRS
ncbi:MAG: arsenate reductase ArsC [Candidatus Poribacteria bacterium]|nr:arsenate reductase ArsC [Candidatus Poribacteria bacterium]